MVEIDISHSFFKEVIMDLSVRHELDNLIYKIESSITALKSALMGDGVVAEHCVYSVKRQGNSRVVDQLSSLKSAVDVYSDFECIAPDNSKETSIYPGYIALNRCDEIDDIRALTSEINTHKQSLKTFLELHNKPTKVRLLSGPQVKVNPLLFEAYPMKNLIQIFREIKMFSNNSAEMLHMKWTRKQRYDKHSIDSALRIVAYNYDKPPALEYSSNAWQNKLVALKERLENLSVKTEIKRIKPAPSIPQIGVKFEGSKTWNKFHGSLPLIVITDDQLKVTAGLSDLPNEMAIDNEKLLELGWVALNEDLGFYLKN